MATVMQKEFSNSFLCVAIGVIQISVKFISNDSINNMPALVELMAWRRTGDRPLYELAMSYSTNAYMGTGPQRVNTL